MKQNISPPVMAAIVIVFVVVVGFLGYKYAFSGNGSSGKPPPEAQKWVNPGGNMRAPGGAAPGSGPPAGYAPGPRGGNARGIQ